LYHLLTASYDACKNCCHALLSYAIIHNTLSPLCSDHNQVRDDVSGWSIVDWASYYWVMWAACQTPGSEATVAFQLAMTSANPAAGTTMQAGNESVAEHVAIVPTTNLLNQQDAWVPTLPDVSDDISHPESIATEPCAPAAHMPDADANGANEEWAVFYGFADSMPWRLSTLRQQRLAPCENLAKLWCAAHSVLTLLRH
jgi:hypothetical protein